MAGVTGKGSLRAMGGRAFLVLVFLFLPPSTPRAAAAGEDAPASLSLLPSKSAGVPGGVVSLAVAVDVRPGYHILRGGAGMQGLEVALSSEGPVSFSPPAYPPGDPVSLDFLDGPAEVYLGRVVVRASAAIAADAPLIPVGISAAVSYQACGEDVCFPPSSEILTLRLPVVRPGSPVEEMNLDVFGAALQEAESGRSYAGWLVTAFLWGIGGCLTPCIYPMIAITMGFFGGQVRGRSRMVLLLAAVYVLGIAVTYSALGVAAALSGRILGSALQHPAVVIGFSLLLAALSLSMFGLYELRAPSFLTRFGGGRAGVAGAFIMGLLVAVIAIPCLGPLTIGLMVYVQKLASAAAGFFIFLSFSLGLGTPFVFLAVFSGSLERLPRSGVWLLWVRKLLGFLLLGLAVYYLGPLLPDRVEGRLFSLLGLAAAATLFFSGRRAAGGRVFPLVRGVAAASAILLSLYALFPHDGHEGPDWIPYSGAALAAAAASEKPVVVLFTAEWCPPCQKMKRGTFRTAEVIRAFEEVAALKADLTSSPSPDVAAAVERYGIKGVPTMIFIDGSGAEARGMRAVGYIGPKTLVSKVEAVKERGSLDTGGDRE